MNYRRFKPVLTFSCLLIVLASHAAESPFAGEWELTLPGPGGNAGWLGVQQQNGQLGVSIMWRAGSVEPVASAAIDGNQLVMTRKHESELKDAQGHKSTVVTIENISCKVEGSAMRGTSIKPRENGAGEDVVEFSGRRQPPMPPAPDLSKVKFGDAISLINGKDLTGWRLTDPHAVNGWSIKDGLLVNNPVQEEGKHKNYGNLRTDKEFEDFSLKVEVRVDKGQNSGVYVRGIYEVQLIPMADQSIPTIWALSTAGLNRAVAPRRRPVSGKPWRSRLSIATSPLS